MNKAKAKRKMHLYVSRLLDALNDGGSLEDRIEHILGEGYHEDKAKVKDAQRMREAFDDITQRHFNLGTR